MKSTHGIESQMSLSIISISGQLKEHFFGYKNIKSQPHKNLVLFSNNCLSNCPSLYFTVLLITNSSNCFTLFVTPTLFSPDFACLFVCLFTAFCAQCLGFLRSAILQILCPTLTQPYYSVSLTEEQDQY